MAIVGAPASSRQSCSAAPTGSRGASSRWWAVAGPKSPAGSRARYGTQGHPQRSGCAIKLLCYADSVWCKHRHAKASTEKIKKNLGTVNAVQQAYSQATVTVENRSASRWDQTDPAPGLGILQSGSHLGVTPTLLYSLAAATGQTECCSCRPYGRMCSRLRWRSSPGRPRRHIEADPAGHRSSRLAKQQRTGGARRDPFALLAPIRRLQPVSACGRSPTKGSQSVVPHAR